MRLSGSSLIPKLEGRGSRNENLVSFPDLKGNYMYVYKAVNKIEWTQSHSQKGGARNETHPHLALTLNEHILEGETERKL